MQWSQLVMMVVVVLVLVTVTAKPQNLGVQVNNNALFTLGVGLLAVGAGYHFGRKHAATQQNRYRYPPNYYRNDLYSPFPGGRFRRQAEPENELDPLVEQLFQMALEKDATGCSLQLTCIIGNKPASSLAGHAKSLYNVLSTVSGKAVTTTKGEWSGLNAYQVALNLGHDGGDCDQLFPHCPTSSHQLMHQFQNMKVIHTN
ncbi:hypothetical protein Hamer_G021772 [Homarus americanus]|uniref:Uncharacterized protein n=2 Tax=Homarus americanus TaxID=6706 RepID=A0A8J5KDB8_HOMAM|nr:hypothetical protein Hamer_G021772 [Homarus americanus]